MGNIYNGTDDYSIDIRGRHVNIREIEMLDDILEGFGEALILSPPDFSLFKDYCESFFNPAYSLLTGKPFKTDLVYKNLRELRGRNALIHTELMARTLIKEDINNKMDKHRCLVEVYFNLEPNNNKINYYPSITIKGDNEVLSCFDAGRDRWEAWSNELINRLCEYPLLHAEAIAIQRNKIPDQNINRLVSPAYNRNSWFLFYRVNYYKTRKPGAYNLRVLDLITRNIKDVTKNINKDLNEGLERLNTFAKELINNNKQIIYKGMEEYFKELDPSLAETILKNLGETTKVAFNELNDKEEVMDSLVYMDKLVSRCGALIEKLPHNPLIKFFKNAADGISEHGSTIINTLGGVIEPLLGLLNNIDDEDDGAGLLPIIIGGTIVSLIAIPVGYGVYKLGEFAYDKIIDAREGGDATTKIFIKKTEKGDYEIDRYEKAKFKKKKNRNLLNNPTELLYLFKNKGETKQVS